MYELDKNIYHKSSGKRGKLLGYDEQTNKYLVQYGQSKPRFITPGTLRTGVIILTNESEITPINDYEERKAVRESLPKDNALTLRTVFINLVKEMYPDINVFCYLDKKLDVIKICDRVVFEVLYTGRWLTVRCNPNALAPLNKRRVTKTYPKSYGWSLRAEYKFGYIKEKPLMKSVISDCVYYIIHDKL